MMLCVLGTARLYQRDVEAADATLRAGLERAQQTGEAWVAARILDALADAAVVQGNAGLAEAHIGLGVYQYIPTIDAARDAAEALDAAERLEPDLAILHVLRGQLKLYLRPDWHEAGPHLERALAIDPNEPMAHAYLAFMHGMLGNLEVARAEAERAIAADPLSLFVRAVAVMGFPMHGIPGADSAAALAMHDAALALDPNSVLHLWLSGTRLSDFGRYAEAVERMARAVELTQRAPLIFGLYGRTLALAGRRAEALAVREELRQRASREYVGPVARLMMLPLDAGDEDAIAALLRENIDAMTGPTAIATTVIRELEPLLDHPRLGPLVRQLTYWATAPVGVGSSRLR